ncbi:MAG: hypothetical protein KDH88_06205 [Chromatiales bacterium]|nr:hypothetical protein [Chromatiales bacterium]
MKPIKTATMALLSLASLSVGTPSPCAELPVAGTAPYQRPQGAPVITTFAKNGAWYERALHGITRPYPASLRFLEDQGAWHTPFNHPGMTAPYDIRGWHHN